MVTISISIPAVPVGKPGGLMPNIFLCAAKGSMKVGAGDVGCDKLGSEPNLRVEGSRGLSKDGLIRFSDILLIGLFGGKPGK